MRWEAVLFDFDGVILDSVDVKTRAFAQMFAGYGPDIEQQVVAYHLEHGGVSRFEKFRYYYEELLGIPIDDDKIQELAAFFSELVLEQVLSSPFVPGAMETLNLLKQSGVPTYIVSGTPHDEIKYIVRTLGLGNFFEDILGSPRQKHDLIADILVQHNYTAGQCLYVGDAKTDYHAAQRAGVCFLGIVKDAGLSPFPPGTPVSACVTVDLPI